ncbi:hypothetical protein KQ693_05920 [Thermus sp. PS18]|uniref:hypothetical protein n=1 Tax=Thermus sp. PS18 TaxID=2849039 RepID=UPI002263B76A|nr:hypothetical protein [Thermus sp. PS18]UZX16566.1 hypothetical protein KQ693_05920 [Thermus sp. PS18]
MSFGVDLTALPEFNPGKLRREYENLAEALARRLMTPRGALWYESEYGTDLRAYLQETVTDEVQYEIERVAVMEVEKDPRVRSATASVTAVGPREFRLSLSVETAAGPYRLVLRVGDVSVEVLYGAPQ